MGDYVFLCNNRWKFKRIIKKVFRILEKLKLEIAYEKTMVGGTATKCFDFLGVDISAEGLRAAKKSVRKFAGNVVLRLSSHSASAAGCFTPDGKADSSDDSSGYATGRTKDLTREGNLPIPDSVSMYVRRWLRWVKSIYGKKEEDLRRACSV